MNKLKINPNYLKNKTRPQLKMMISLLEDEVFELHQSIEKITNPVTVRKVINPITEAQQAMIEKLAIMRKEKEKRLEEILSDPERKFEERLEHRKREASNRIILDDFDFLRI
jgi:hypothetical protein